VRPIIATVDWGAWQTFIAVVGFFFAFWGGYAVKRRKDQAEITGEVKVTGHVRTQEQHEVVTVERMTLQLRDHPTRGDLTATENRLETRIEQKFDALDLKRSADIRKLHEELKVTDNKVSALDERSQNHTITLQAIDAKLTNLLQRKGTGAR
jgi:phage host-nuclease inhibitor protein Gam